LNLSVTIRYYPLLSVTICSLVTTSDGVGVVGSCGSNNDVDNDFGGQAVSMHVLCGWTVNSNHTNLDTIHVYKKHMVVL
jgi:hypothetical protein